MGPITPDELDHTLRRLPRGKAPGKSGLINELWTHAGPRCKDVLRLLLNECLRLEDIPTPWKQSVIVPIPKTPEFTGNLDQLRPIALLESSRKILSAILTRRLSKPWSSTECSRGLNLGFRANRQAADLAFAIQGLCEASHLAEKPLELLSLDVRRAYDSVSLTTLQHSLRRIRVPEGYIRMLSNIHSGRSAQILTAFGLTQPFHACDGTGPRRDQRSRSVAHRVRSSAVPPGEERQRGPTGRAGPVHTSPGEDPPISTRRSGRHDVLRRSIRRRSHADGNEPGRSPRAGRHLQRLVRGARHRDQPSEIGAPVVRPEEQQAFTGSHIQLGTGATRAPVLKIQPPKEPLRILGMYIVPNGTHGPVHQMCVDLASSQAKLLRSRAMTDKIALFVVRAVMMPALTHKMQGHAFSPKEMHQIFKPIMHALKHACGLPTSFPSSLMHHRLAGNVPRLETVHTANNLTLLVRAMNMPSPLAEIIMTRIAATEHATRFPGPMLEVPWHVQPGHVRSTANGRRRLLIPDAGHVPPRARTNSGQANVLGAVESGQHAPGAGAVTLAPRRLSPSGCPERKWQRPTSVPVSGHRILLRTTGGETQQRSCGNLLDAGHSSSTK